MAVEEQITISAIGGDEAAAQINKASRALENTATSSHKMQEKFQEKFQHMGLKLFANDALRASGLGGEARAIISTINLALNETAAVAGISSGGIMLIVVAIGALVGMLIKLHEKQGDMLEQTQKAIEADEKHLKTLRDKIKELDDYAAVGGRLNKVQQDYLTTLKGIAAEEAAKKNSDLMERIQLLNQLLVKEKEDLDNQSAQVGRAGGAVTLWGNATSNAAKLTEEIKKNTLALREAEVQMNSLHKTGTGTFKDMADSAKSSAEAKTRADHRAFEDWQAHINAMSKANHAALQGMTKDYEKESTEQIKMIEHVGGQIGSEIGGAFAKSLVEGQNFTEGMHKAFRSMTELIIQDIIKMIVEWTILQTISMGAAGSFGSFASHAFGRAVGGDMLVDKPTLFMAGEAGPERATFTPLAGASSAGPATSGGGGGSQVFNIGPVVTNVTGANDPDKLAQSIGRKIIEQIRGAGQISFVRS